jgi:hypothetical protein
VFEDLRLFFETIKSSADEAETPAAVFAPTLQIGRGTVNLNHGSGPLKTIAAVRSAPNSFGLCEVRLCSQPVQ